MCPDNLFPDKINPCRFCSFLKEVGMVPVNKFSGMLRKIKLMRFSSAAGIILDI